MADKPTIEQQMGILLERQLATEFVVKYALAELLRRSDQGTEVAARFRREVTHQRDAQPGAAGLLLLAEAMFAEAEKRAKERPN